MKEALILLMFIVGIALGVHLGQQLAEPVAYERCITVFPNQTVDCKEVARHL